VDARLKLIVMWLW